MSTAALPPFFFLFPGTAASGAASASPGGTASPATTNQTSGAWPALMLYQLASRKLFDSTGAQGLSSAEMPEPVHAQTAMFRQ